MLVTLVRILGVITMSAMLTTYAMLVVARIHREDDDR